MPRNLAKKEQIANVQFVLEIEKHPCLYNYTLEEYSKRDVVDAAWENVAKTFEDTVENCKEKWKNLRTVFVRKLKLSPNEVDRKVRYYLTDVMQFIIPFVKIQNNDGIANNLMTLTKNKIVTKLTGDEADSEDIDKDEVKEDGNPLEENFKKSMSTQKPHSMSTEKSKKVYFISETSEASKIKEDKEKRKSNAFGQHFQEKKNKLNESNGSRKMFLLSLVPEVEAMADYQFRQFRRNVLDAIDNVLDKPHIFSTTHVK